MSNETSEAPGGAFPGGLPTPRLCLNFVNTEGSSRNDPPDRLDTLDLFIEWASSHGLGELHAPEPGHSEELLARGRELRETLYRVLSASIRREEPEADDLTRLNGALAEALTRLRLASAGGEVVWAFDARGQTLDDVLDLVSISAAKLLTSKLLRRVKECESETCSWMFLDESRNHSRRWCDMSACGNRAKARRYYRRHGSPDPES